MGIVYNMLFGGAQKPINRDPKKVVAMPKPVIKAFDWLAERPMYEPLRALCRMESTFLKMDGKPFKDALIKCNSYESSELYLDGLHGTLFYSATPSKKFVLGIHGYRMNSISEFARYVPIYHDMGYNFLAIDNCGAGESEGEFVSFGVKESADAIRWAKLLVEKFGQDIEILIYGLSLGGATTLIACGDKNLPSQVRCAIVDSPYSSFRAEEDYILSLLKLPEAVYPVFFFIINYVFKKNTGLSLRDAAPIKSVKKALVPILFIHGEDDVFVPSKFSKELVRACGSQSQLELFDEASHCQSFHWEPERYTALIRSWAEKYM